jgi:hypothetical protein
MPNLISGKRVVQPNGSPDNEGAICQVVGIAGGPLFHLPIDYQRADLQGVFAGQSAGRVAGF